ncbi:hypothetical protein ACFRCG_39880 [Embleya sp. NPDC056575]|uniref:hypothetical protein n=1 Tax=unclassified Embleya TaxID=2699296 RepID=UPI0036B12ACB
MADDQGTTSTDGTTAQDPATGTTQPARETFPDGLGDAGKRALTEEREARREAERTATERQKQLDAATAELQQFRDRDKTEAERLAERAATAEATAATAQSRLMKYEVAAEKRLPPTLAARLQGSTREELAADADALLADLGKQQQAMAPSFDGGVRTTAAAPADMNTLIRRAAGHQ